MTTRSYVEYLGMKKDFVKIPQWKKDRIGSIFEENQKNLWKKALHENETIKLGYQIEFVMGNILNINNDDLRKKLIMDIYEYSIEMDYFDIIENIVSHDDFTHLKNELFFIRSDSVFVDKKQYIDIALNNDADINYDSGRCSDEDGGIPIFAHSDNFETFKYLVDKGADVSIKNTNGENILMQKFDIKVGKYVLEKYKLNINEKDNDGLTALIHAIKHKNIQVLKFLIEFGANVNDEDNNGHSAMLYSFYTGNPDIVNFMMQNDAKFKETEAKEIDLLVKEISSKYKIVSYLSLSDFLSKFLEYSEDNFLRDITIFLCNNNYLTQFKFFLRENRPRHELFRVLAICWNLGKLEFVKYIVNLINPKLTELKVDEQPLFEYLKTTGRHEFAKYLESLCK